MPEIENLPTDALEKLVDETEETLLELKAELKSRREAAQRREIDRLEEHMANATVNLQSLRTFIDHVLRELRRPN